MTLVWTVEQGEYSDYSVLGVFSTKENAERVATIVGGGAEVVERRLDPIIEDLNEGRNFYYVSMLKDGTVTRVERDTPSSYNIDGFDSFPWIDHRQHELGTYYSTFAWAKDDVHAVKIVNERRVQKIANNEWRYA